MSNQVINRTKELSLLGWSEDGARRYSELVDNSEIVNQIYLLFPESMSKMQVQFALFIILLTLIFGSILLARLYEYLNKPEPIENITPSPILVDEDIAENKSNVDLTILRAGLTSLGASLFMKTLKFTNEVVDFVSLERKPKTPFFKYFSNLFQETTVNTDSLIEHSLLATLLVYETSRKAIKLIPKLDTNFSTSNQALNIRSFLIDKNDLELRELLKGNDLLPSFNKNELIDLIFSNPIAFEKARLEVRKSDLKKKTVPELRQLLKGVNGISKLRKSELIEQILISEPISK